MNAKLAKHLRRIAREAVPDASRAYVDQQQRSVYLKPGKLGDLETATLEHNVVRRNKPGTQRAAYLALKREAVKHPVRAVKAWRLKEKAV